MSIWNRDPRGEGDLIDLAYPPATGSRVKISLLGFALPAWLIYHGVNAWLAQRAYLPGRHGGEWLIGDSARAMAVVCLGFALFAHARWFWGELPNEWWFEKLTITAALLIIGGMFATLYLALV